MRGIIGLGRVIAVALALAASSGAIAAESDVWSVSRSTGEVWIAATGEAKQVSLKQDEALKPGDTIRTGRNGRVLLIRGEETILIAPNSVVGLPLEKKDGLSTTILQQAGSILLDVEKRNVKHFEVETPYLAAVVKGTQFSVTVSAIGTRVDVRRGQVEVADFKSGQIAQVLPGQIATSFAHGKAGLSLTGAGVLNPIEHGRPRASSIERVPVPKGGLSAPHNAGSGKSVHALGHIDVINGKLGTEPLQQKQAADRAPIKPNVIRIPGALGEVTLNVQKATRGLAHGSVMPGVKNSSARNSPTKNTVWSDAKANASGVSALGQDSSNGGNAATAAGVGAGAVSGVTATAVIAPSNGNGNDNGNGATGNGKGNGNGNNGNGNGNNGNGNAYGHSKNK
ncbi:MAG TPA: FecR family protein [Bradyrhizobium sp.]|nr:FecR family protein [Bradyrhizobium sp.]